MEEIVNWATPLVACSTFFVAFMQWRLARKRVRLDFYDRRYKVYDAARTLLIAIVTEGKASPKAYQEFSREVAPAEFLFAASVREYIESVQMKSAELTLVLAKMENPNYEGYQADVDRQLILYLWFESQIATDGLRSVFKPYLSFDKTP